MARKKTPDYTRRAVDKYTESRDRIAAYFPKGVKTAIQKTGMRPGEYVIDVVVKDLTSRGLWPPEEAQDGEEVKSEL